MSEYTPEELHDFASKHAPKLAEKITQLCGAVIAKGMTGILEEVCRIQQEADTLRAVNADLLAALKGVGASWGSGFCEGESLSFDKARAAIASAEQAQKGGA